jgi:hypothetical protein
MSSIQCSWLVVPMGLWYPDSWIYVMSSVGRLLPLRNLHWLTVSRSGHHHDMRKLCRISMKFRAPLLICEIDECLGTKSNPQTTSGDSNRGQLTWIISRSGRIVESICTTEPGRIVFYSSLLLYPQCLCKVRHRDTRVSRSRWFDTSEIRFHA